MTKKQEHITLAEPSLGIWTSLGFRGVAPQMRDQAAYLTLGGGAGGRSLGSIQANADWRDFGCHYGLRLPQYAKKSRWLLARRRLCCFSKRRSFRLESEILAAVAAIRVSFLDRSCAYAHR
jgi:hypothetical protein